MANPPIPTVRTIASAAGVSPSTVSLSLRNLQRIPLKTRRHVQATAKAMGYRLDPLVRRLMHHLRTRRSTRAQANICVLVPQGGTIPKYYSPALLNGMGNRAIALGYILTALEFNNTDADNKSLTRILRSRGIEGAIFAPMQRPQALLPSFDHSNLSVVAATSSVLKPQFHSVMPNHYDNMMLACRKLIEGGTTRIGLAISSNHDFRVRHRSAGAIAWNILFKQSEFVAPFVVPDPDSEHLSQWLASERPEAVIVDYDMERLIAPLIAAKRFSKRKIRIITTNWPSQFAVAGIDQREMEIGLASVDILAGMLERGEKGVPKYPRFTMIDGIWRS